MKTLLACTGGDGIDEWASASRDLPERHHWLDGDGRRTLGHRLEGVRGSTGDPQSEIWRESLREACAITAGDDTMANPEDMDFDFQGPRDGVEDFIADIIVGPRWSLPDSFMEETSIWYFSQEYLEVGGYITIIEDRDYETDIPGMDFGWYGVRLDKSESEIRAYAREVIGRDFPESDETLKGYYEEYVNQLLQDMTDVVPPVPGNVLNWMEHEPVLGLIHLNERGPMFTSMAYSGSPDHDAPDLLLRYDLAPCAAPYVCPIGFMTGSRDDRYEQFREVLRMYLEANGLGRKLSSRPILQSWPTAVVLCTPTAYTPMWVANGLATGAEQAGLSAEAELDWDQFRTWWADVTSPATVDEALARLQTDWYEAITARTREPKTGWDEAASWISVFATAWKEAMDNLSYNPPDPACLPLEDRKPESRVYRWGRGPAGLRTLMEEVPDDDFED